MKNHFLHQKVFDEAVQQFNITLKYLKSMLSMNVTTCNIFQCIDVHVVGSNPTPFFGAAFRNFPTKWMFNCKSILHSSICAGIFMCMCGCVHTMVQIGCMCVSTNKKAIGYKLHVATFVLM